MHAIKCIAFVDCYIQSDTDYTSKQHRHCFSAITLFCSKEHGRIPKSFKIFALGNGRKRSAIIVNNNNIDVKAIQQVSYEDAILIELSYEGLNFYGASLYFPIDREIKRGIETVEEIIQLMKGRELILSIDSNSRSKLWCDTNNNQRGKSQEEFITSDLLLMNEAASIPTFETIRGRSWIDLTL
jgi:hypothetical protein